MPNAHLNTMQLAALLGLKPGTLQKQRSLGYPEHPPFVRFGRSVRYDAVELKKWLESKKIKQSEGVK